MAVNDNTDLNQGHGGDAIRTLAKTSAVKTQVVALDIGGAGAEQLVTGALPVSGTITVGNMIAQGLTDAQLRAAPVPVAGTVTLIDGADVNQGATIDAAVITDTTGTMSGKLRGIVKILASVWDSVSGRLKVDASSNAIVSAGNSTTTPLGVGGNFTGTVIDLLDYSTLRVSIFSNVASATLGFGVDFSNNGTNWDFPKRTTYADPGDGETIVFNRVARYARINYTNGGAAQATFRLQTLLAPNSTEFVRHFMSDVPEDSDTGIMTQSVVVGKTTGGGGGYVPVKVNPSGALTAEVTVKNIAGAQINPSSSDVTQPVSGTVAVSNMVALGLTDTQLRATAVPVSGAFYQATQPVSGTFWQTTQPVSIASMPSTPVTGTFWQATQPVSGAFYQATQPVSIAATVATAEVAPTAVAHAKVTVTTAGTRVQLATNTAKAIVVKASVANTGTIYVGGSTVASTNGFPLAAGDTVALDISNTNVIWIDSSVNGESATWMSNS